LEVLDKGKAASVTTIVYTKDIATGNVIFENQITVFIRGAGGFGGKRSGRDRGAATAVNTPPKRQPDAVIEEKTSASQAALYRLSGDYNPLHIDPSFAAIGGFDQPILHGLCFMGIAGKHVLQSFGAYKDIKVRFSGVVFPGETLVTEMWKTGSKVIFSTKTKERGTTVLAAAAVTLVDTDTMAKL
jgi:acyl dehydratase